VQATGSFLGGGFFITLLTGAGLRTTIGSIYLGVGSFTSGTGSKSSKSEDSGSLYNLSSLSSSSSTPTQSYFVLTEALFFFFFETAGPAAAG